MSKAAPDNAAALWDVCCHRSRSAVKQAPAVCRRVARGVEADAAGGAAAAGQARQRHRQARRLCAEEHLGHAAFGPGRLDVSLSDPCKHPLRPAVMRVPANTALLVSSHASCNGSAAASAVTPSAHDGQSQTRGRSFSWWGGNAQLMALTRRRSGGRPATTRCSRRAGRGSPSGRSRTGRSARARTRSCGTASA